MKQEKIKKLVIAALCLALAYILPFFTGQIPEIGSMLLPMHIPVIICGFICGWPYGLLVGFIAPLTRSLTLGMPPLFPQALAMAFELAAYGFISGFIYEHSKKTKIGIYIALLSAMVIGRIVWGVVMLILMGISGNGFTMAAFIAGTLTGAIPGIILQIVLIPLIVMLIKR